MTNAQVKDKFKGLFSKDNIARIIFIFLAIFSILAVFTIIGYLLYASIPAFRQIGFFKFIFGSEWSAKSETFGIWRMIVGTFVLTVCAVLLGGTLAVFTAIWLVFYCPKKIKKIYTQIINLLAGIPSIVYGLFGYKFLMPLLVDIFHPNNAGFGLLACTLILSVMILPTITSITKNSLEAVPMHYYEGALALGCTKNQAVWKVLLPAAKSGIISAVILGVGRAIGETMAVQMIVGNGSGYPLGAFVPFTTLTSNIVQNWGYATPSEQSALIADGFVLLIFILILNLCLMAVKKPKSGNKFFSRRLKEGEKNDALKSYRRTGSIQDVLWIVSWVVAVLVAFVLAFIVIFVFVKGIPNLSIDFMFGESSNAHTTLAPAFVSTVMLIGLALLIALPLGIGAAIYLNEYAKKGSIFVKTIRLFVDTLAGIPSIIFGLFGMIFFVRGMNMGYSLAAGGITLALIILPTIIRSTEQSLSEVPDSMREASYALGAGKLRTIFVVVLPQAIAGIITSIILSIGRIVNESAALIFTVGSASTFVPLGYGDSAASFSVLVWKFMSNGLQVNEAYATAAVLLIFVIILNLLVSLVEYLFNRRKKI
ncbi:MAG: phosphate ABC transporter permease PstA [Corallococcus sp.]|nr:phosphate ABC transporter permease PstA [Corallococcus sp.]